VSEEVTDYIREEMKKGRNALKAAEKLLAESLLDDAVSRAYYAVFHSARSALMTKSIETKTHQGLIRNFALHLVKPGIIEVEYGDILRQEKEDRETGDYEPFVTFEHSEAEKRVQDAKRFLERIEQFLKESGILLQ
jgi:hypothetical protein